MSLYDDLLRLANSIADAKDMSMALKDLRELYLEDVALTAKAIYDEHLKVGFSKGQAFELAKEYTLDMCKLEFNQGEEVEQEE